MNNTLIPSDVQSERNLWLTALLLTLSEALGIPCFTAGNSSKSEKELSLASSRNIVENDHAWFKALCDFAGLDWRWVKRIYHMCKENPDKINMGYLKAALT